MAKNAKKTNARKPANKASAKSARGYADTAKIITKGENPYRDGKDFNRVFAAIGGKTVASAKAAVAKLKGLGTHATLSNVLRDAKERGCVKVA